MTHNDLRKIVDARQADYRAAVSDELVITVGRLLCRSIRDLLTYLVFKGARIEWFESSGLFVRSFVIKGKPEILSAIRVVIEDRYDTQRSPKDS